MRIRFLLLGFAVLLATGCTGLGIRQLDLSELRPLYTNEASRFIEVEGVRIHTRAEGSGPAVLLLHGVMASLHTWDGWVDELSDSYRLIRLDIPGFGLSGASPALDDAAMVRLVDEVLAEYDVESAILVGNSLGGYIASYYAAHNPERVEALVLISPAAYPQTMPRSLRLAAMPVVGKAFEMATPRFIVRRVLRDVYGDSTEATEETVDRYFDLCRATGNRKAARQVFREMAERMKVEPAWLAEVSQPTLLLWGEQDSWVPVALNERWKEDIPHARLITYPGVGHVAMEEIPSATATDFRRFILGLVIAELSSPGQSVDEAH